MSDRPSADEDPFATRHGRLPDPTRPLGETSVPLTRRAARQAARDADAARQADAAGAQRVPPATMPVPVPSPRGTLDDLFAGDAATDAVGAVPPSTGHRRHRRRRWIAAIVVILLLGGIAGGGTYAWKTFIPQIRAMVVGQPTDYPSGHAHGTAMITIVAGDNGLSISKTLAAAGVTLTAHAFYDMLVNTGATPTFYPGVYRLQKEMTAQAALKALQDPANRMKDSALLREGITESQALQTIAQTLKMPLAELQAAAADPGRYGVQARSLEGWLFPAVYTFPPHTTATTVIQTLVNRTVQSLNAAGVAPADRQRVLTIASIIQREARQTSDFYKVSRVIENRLNTANPATGGKLQMDSTAQYGYGQLHDGHASSSAAALASDNPWNTYVHPGLPIGPIANPGDLAIDAALHPAPGTWLYFVTVNLDTGQTVFSTTYAEQQQAVAQMQAWCKANPDSGC